MSDSRMSKEDTYDPTTRRQYGRAAARRASAKSKRDSQRGPYTDAQSRQGDLHESVPQIQECECRECSTGRSFDDFSSASHNHGQAWSGAHTGYGASPLPQTADSYQPYQLNDRTPQHHTVYASSNETSDTTIYGERGTQLPFGVTATAYAGEGIPATYANMGGVSSHYTPPKYPLTSTNQHDSLSHQFEGIRVSTPVMRRKGKDVSDRSRGDEKLENSFMVIRDGGRFFKVGRVFMCLWTEPAGNTDGGDTDRSSNVSAVMYNEKAYSKIRRFVVVSEHSGRGCSTCLPISTYGHQGTKKRGVIPQDHAAVYADGGKPKFQPGENLTKESFPIIVEDKRVNIDPMSRLNFSRVYTIEHNVKVKKIGRIHESKIKLLRKYYKDFHFPDPDLGPDEQGYGKEQRYELTSAAPSTQMASQDGFQIGPVGYFPIGASQMGQHIAGHSDNSGFGQPPSSIDPAIPRSYDNAPQQYGSSQSQGYQSPPKSFTTHSRYSTDQSYPATTGTVEHSRSAYGGGVPQSDSLQVPSSYTTNSYRPSSQAITVSSGYFGSPHTLFQPQNSTPLDSSSKHEPDPPADAQSHMASEQSSAGDGQWIFESQTGRQYRNRKDAYGREVRQYDGYLPEVGATESYQKLFRPISPPVASPLDRQSRGHQGKGEGVYVGYRGSYDPRYPESQISLGYDTVDEDNTDVDGYEVVSFDEAGRHPRRIRSKRNPLRHPQEQTDQGDRACDQCREVEAECEGGIPCMLCQRRRQRCSFTVPASHITVFG